MSRRPKLAIVDPWDPPFERRGRKAAHREILTDDLIRGLMPKEREYSVYDWDCPGLYVRVRSTGNLTFYYRPQLRRHHKDVRIGSPAKLTVAAARTKAAEVDELLFQGRSLGSFEPSKYSKTIRHAFDQYMSHEPLGVWQRRVWRMFHDTILPALGEVKLQSLTYGQIDDLLGAAPTYYAQRNPRVAVSAFLTWCVSKGLVDTNVVKGRRAGSAPLPRRRHSFNGAQLGAIWNACGALPPKWRDAFRLVIATGFPISAVLSLRPVHEYRQNVGPVATELLEQLSCGRLGYLFRAPGKFGPMTFQQSMLERLRTAADMGPFTIGDLQRSAISLARTRGGGGIQWDDLFPPEDMNSPSHDTVIL